MYANSLKLNNIIEYQAQLTKKIALDAAQQDLFITFQAMQQNFIVPIQMLHSLILWQNPKKIYPNVPHILGFILTGQVITTVIALEKMQNLPFQYSLSLGGLNYQFILSLNSAPAISFALNNCQLINIATQNNYKPNDLNTIMLNQAWLNKYIYVS
jgi:chemotaxis signal transduction protein